MTLQKQRLWLTGILISSIIALLCAPPIYQPAEYHNFADQHGLQDIPNFLNVMSNLPFLFVGIAGIRLCLRRQDFIARYSWLWFFGAFALVGLGSGYYHWAPTDTTLVFDRLPMTLAFMSLFSALLNETVLPGSERWLLPLLLILGPLGVLYWYCSGDLRLYAWVQFVPLLFIALLLCFNALRIQRGYLYAAFGAYVLAKLFEALDWRVYELTQQLLSGHSVKHLWAAASGYLLYRMLKFASAGPQA